MNGPFSHLPVNRAFRIIQCCISHILLRLEVCQPPVTPFGICYLTAVSTDCSERIIIIICLGTA